ARMNQKRRFNQPGKPTPGSERMAIKSDGSTNTTVRPARAISAAGVFGGVVTALLGLQMMFFGVWGLGEMTVSRMRRRPSAHCSHAGRSQTVGMVGEEVSRVAIVPEGEAAGRRLSA